MEDWEELRKFEMSTEHQSRSIALMELARQKASTTSQAAAAQASKLTHRLRLLATRRRTFFAAFARTLAFSGFINLSGSLVAAVPHFANRGLLSNPETTQSLSDFRRRSGM
jgi:hypothetical protein